MSVFVYLWEREKERKMLAQAKVYHWPKICQHFFCVRQRFIHQLCREKKNSFNEVEVLMSSDSEVYFKAARLAMCTGNLLLACTLRTKQSVHSIVLVQWLHLQPRTTRTIKKILHKNYSTGDGFVTERPVLCIGKLKDCSFE